MTVDHGLTTFEKKFGADFLAGVPKQPGVYRFFSKNDVVLYVGKAKTCAPDSLSTATQSASKHRR